MEEELAALKREQTAEKERWREAEHLRAEEVRGAPGQAEHSRALLDF